MRYIGLDIATTTGWALLENDVLLERGTIQLISQMDLPQKLHYFHLELRSLLTRLQPEWIFIEDVILGISGAKTLAYLARLNGVAIATSFEFLQERVKLYSPPYWKSHSFEGLGGMAKKWQIQLAAVEHYNLPITGDFSDISKVVISKDLIKNQIKSESDVIRTRLNQLKAKSVRKKDPPSQDEKIYLNDQIKECTRIIANNKKTLKDNEKKLDKTFAKISIDIAAQTGMTENICDACGVALCGYKETLNESV